MIGAFGAHVGTARADALPLPSAPSAPAAPSPPATAATAAASSAGENATAAVAATVETATEASSAATTPVANTLENAAAKTPATTAPVVEATSRTLTRATSTVGRAVASGTRLVPNVTGTVAGTVTEQRVRATAPEVVRHNSGSAPIRADAHSSPRLVPTAAVTAQAPDRARAGAPTAREVPVSVQTQLVRVTTFSAPPLATFERRPSASGPAPPGPDDDAPAPLPSPTNGTAFGSAPSSGGAGVLIALLLGFVLAIPNAGRWLRPALALGLSPRTVSPVDRPG